MKIGQVPTPEPPIDGGKPFRVVWIRFFNAIVRVLRYNDGKIQELESRIEALENP